VPAFPNKSLFSAENDILRSILRRERERLDLTQAAVAEGCDWPQSVIAKIEQGERRLDLVEFVWLSRAMGLPPERLLRRVLKGISEAARKKNSGVKKN
jgi:transcriptional regulator with XRE-family HTH domain